MRKIIWFGVILILWPISVNGAVLSCPEKVALGATFSCQIESDEKVGFMGKYQVDTVFKYIGVNNLSSWKTYYTGSRGIVVGKKGEDSKFRGEIQFRVEMNAVPGQMYPIGVVGIEEVNGDYETVGGGDLTSSVMVVSDINTLSSLTISNGNLTPKFDSEVLAYKATVEVAEIEITAVATDGNAVVSGDLGKKELAYGGNVFVIKVTSQMGNVREYKLYITRSIKTNDKVVEGAVLESLKINDQIVELVKDKFYYEMDVANEVINLDIEAVASDSRAVVTIEKSDELVVGDNTVKIIVTAADGTSASYVVVVKRQEKLSSENRIYDLKIDGYEINFDSDKESYELEIHDEDKLKIDVELVDDKASYKIKGNKNLENGSKIVIEVTAEDGSKREYEIRIKTEYDKNSSSIFESLRIWPLVIFVIVGIILLVVRRIRKKVGE